MVVYIVHVFNSTLILRSFGTLQALVLLAEWVLISTDKEWRSVWKNLVKTGFRFCPTLMKQIHTNYSTQNGLEAHCFDTLRSVRFDTAWLIYRVQPTLVKLVGVAKSSKYMHYFSSHTKTLELMGNCGIISYTGKMLYCIRALEFILCTDLSFVHFHPQASNIVIK